MGAILLLESMQLVAKEFTELHLLVVFLIFYSSFLRIDVVLTVLDIIFVLKVLFDKKVVILNICWVTLCIPGNIFYELSLIGVHLLFSFFLDHFHVTSFVEAYLSPLVGLSADQILFELFFQFVLSVSKALSDHFLNLFIRGLIKVHFILSILEEVNHGSHRKA